MSHGRPLVGLCSPQRGVLSLIKAGWPQEVTAHGSICHIWVGSGDGGRPGQQSQVLEAQHSLDESGSEICIFYRFGFVLRFCSSLKLIADCCGVSLCTLQRSLVNQSMWANPLVFVLLVSRLTDFGASVRASIVVATCHGSRLPRA